MTVTVKVDLAIIPLFARTVNKLLNLFKLSRFILANYIAFVKLLFSKIAKIIPQNISYVFSVNFELNIRLPKNYGNPVGRGVFCLGNPGKRGGLVNQ